MKVEIAPFVSWQEHLDEWEWDQGDHVSLIGPTKSGKTTLQGRILPRRAHVVVLACKPRDATLDAMIRRDGYRVVRRWEDVGYRRSGQRIVLWPKGRDADELEGNQYREFRACLDETYTVGGWCVALDELAYVCEILSLERPLKRLWAQGRSLGATVVASMQAPVYVPRAAFDQIMHLYVWRQRDGRRVRTIADVAGAVVDPVDLQRAVFSLGDHDVLFVDGSTGAMRRTLVEGG